ncbi:MAG: AI-2E family transporter [Gemmatimonadaceae bacterium]
MTDSDNPAGNPGALNRPRPEKPGAPMPAGALATDVTRPHSVPKGVQPPFERRRRAVGWRSGDVLRAAALVIAMYVVIQLLWHTSVLIFVIFLAMLFGLAVSAGVDRLQRFRIPRGIAAALIVLSFFGLLVGFGAIMAPTLAEQSRELQERLPQAIEKVEGWVNQNRTGALGFLLDDGSVETAVDPLAPAPPAADSGVLDAGAAQPAATMRDRIGEQLRASTRYLFPFLSSTVAIFSGILLVVFVSIYIAADPRVYHRGIMHLFPHGMRERAGEVFSTTATVLRKWLVTQLIGMTTIGVVTTIVLLVLDVRAAFALGLLAGLLEFVPTVGPIISAVPAIAMGFLDSPEKALWVTLAYIGIQFFENTILIPNLMREGLDIPPALTLVAQALMAMLFGFLGLLVAVPMLAAIMVPIKLLYVEGVVGDEVDILDENNDEEDADDEEADDR